MSLYEKMFGQPKPKTPKEELERQLRKFRKEEEHERKVPVIPPALKKAGLGVARKFKEASIRMAEEERKHKPKTPSKGIFEAFKEASIRAYEAEGAPGFGVPQARTPKYKKPKMVTDRYKKQRKPKQKEFNPWM